VRLSKELREFRGSLEQVILSEAGRDRISIQSKKSLLQIEHPKERATTIPRGSTLKRVEARSPWKQGDDIV
jgi:hypothetical protein